MNDVIDFKSSKRIHDLKPRRSRVMILASSTDGIIGKDNSIPWDCSTDMKFFKRATTGNVVIMGRKTFESMNSKPLPNRVNIVISKTLGQERVEEGVIVITNITDALTYAKGVDLSEFKRNTQSNHIFIIGGTEIYRQSLHLVDEILYSEIDITCGSGNSGSGFIVDMMEEWFENDSTNTEVIYYNNNAVETKDKDELHEITHCYSNDAYDILRFKED